MRSADDAISHSYGKAPSITDEPLFGTGVRPDPRGMMPRRTLSNDRFY
ncbi:MAG: hypothetical protein JXQ99_26650 [Hyphomicrobiaceae bacterium]